MLVFAAILLATGLAVHCAVDELSKLYSIRDLLKIADARGYAGASVYTLHQIDRTAEFYAAVQLGEKIPMGVNPLLLSAKNADALREKT